MNNYRPRPRPQPRPQPSRGLMVDSARALVKNDLYPGEWHGIIQFRDKAAERAAYMGPGTQVLKRLKRGIKGKSPVDEVSKQHDIEYSLAETPSDVTRADNKMIKRIRNIGLMNKDKRFNIAQANLIKLKRSAEKVLGENRLKFASLKGAAPAEKRLLKSHLKPIYGA